MGPGAATENKHHHICAEVIFETDHYSIGSCRICGRYLFILGNNNKTTYYVASEQESELIISIIHMKEQLARMEKNSKT